LQRGVIIIPARLSSKRLPGKLLMKAGGKTVLEWTYDNACKVARRLDCDVAVAVPDSETQDFAQLPIKWYTTPSSCTNGTERCAAFLHHHGGRYDFAINLQADWPLIKPSVIVGLYEEMAVDRFPLATVVAETTERTKSQVEYDFYGECFYRAPPDKPQGSYQMHAGIYGYHRGLLQWYRNAPMSESEKRESLEQLRFTDNNLQFHFLHVKPDDVGFGIDDQESFDRFKEMVES